MPGTTKPNSTWVIQPNHIFFGLAATVAAAAAGHLAVHLASFFGEINETPLAVLFRFFNMGTEANFPTFISTTNLLIAGLLSALIAYRESSLRQRPNLHWWGLAAMFIALGLDESAMIHEGLVGSLLQSQIGRGEGVFYYVWYKVYIPLVLAIICLYLPFLRRLKWRYSSRILLSGLMFVGGAIGVEMVESYLTYRGMDYKGVSILLEETMEMLGVVVYIHTLLLYLSDARYALTVRFSALPSAPNRPDRPRQIPITALRLPDQG